MRKTGMRLLAVLLAVVMVLPSVLIPGMAAEATGFTDVPEGSWYEDAVNYVSEKGYMAGVGDNRFAPNDEVTRAMFVTILARITMAETDGTASAFTDVPANKWYTGAVSWAAENGIVNGVGDGMFAPGKSITRQDLCTILYRYINVMGYELPVGMEKTFTDAGSISSYAADAVRYASTVGLIAGYSDGTFRPKETATRAQMAVIIMRLARLLDGQIVKPEPMPAQSFNESADQMGVSVQAPTGALPRNTEMHIVPVSDEAKLAEIHSAVKADLIGAVDISFTKDGVEVEPERKVNVRISMNALKGAKNPTVVHIRDDGSFEHIYSTYVTTRGASDTIEFEADSFSIYAIISGEGLQARLMVNFHIPSFNDDGTYKVDENDDVVEEIKTVYVTKMDVVNGDLMDDNGNSIGDIDYLPTIIPDYAVDRPANGPKFFGWSLTEAYTENDARGLNGSHDITTVRNHVKEFLETHTISDCEKNQTIDVYPILYYFYSVSYKNETGDATLDTVAFYSKTPRPLTQIFYNYEPQTVGKAFDCWYNPENGETIQQNSHITLTTPNLVLRAKLKDGYFIIFDEKPGTSKPGVEDDYKGATYVAPIWCPDGNVPTEQLPKDQNMKLKGYSFGGWYLKEQFTEGETAEQDSWSGAAYTFPTKITANVNLVARWNAADTTYIIRIELQNKTDEWNTANTEKTYSFYKNLSGNATTYQNVNVANAHSEFTVPANVIDADAGLAKFFEYNAANSTLVQKINSNGSTTFVIRFDRKTITYNTYAQFENHFTYFSGSALSAISSTSATNTDCYYNINFHHFGKIGNEYVALNLEPKTGDADKNGNIHVSNCKWTVASTGADYPVTHSTYPNYPTYYYPDAAIYVPVTVYSMNSNNPPTSFPWFSCKGLYGSAVKEGDWKFYSSSEDTQFVRWIQYEGGASSYGTGPVIYSPSASQNETENIWLAYSIPRARELEYKTYYADTDGEYSEENAKQNYLWYMTYTTYFTNITGFSLEKLVIDGVTYQDGTSHPLVTNGNGRVRIIFNYTPNGGHAAGDYNCTSSLAVYYKRNQHQLKFYIDNEPKKTETVYYAKALSGYNYTPVISENQFFTSWYTDQACKTPVDWDTISMPDTDLSLYTQLQNRRYRVFLHVNMDGIEENNYDWPAVGGHLLVDWTESDQAKNFQITYGEAISSGQPIMGTAIDASGAKYALVGWYTDPACQHAFDFTQVLTEANTVAYDKTEPTDGPDKDHEHPYNKDADQNRVWVIGKLDLYAKWRKLLDGATGIDVIYDAHENETEDGKGHFSGTDQYFYDMLHYADGANAFAEAGSTPNKETRQFKHWDILKWDEATGEYISSGNVVLPGNSFNVKASMAKQEDEAAAHTHRLTYVPARQATCIDDGHGAYYWCAACQTYFRPDNNTVSFTPEIQDSTGIHNFTEYVDGGESGHYHVCSVCGARETPEPEAHTYDSGVITLPTQTEQGYTTYTCTACGRSYKDDYTDPTGRQFTVTFTVPSGVAEVASMECREGDSITLPVADAPAGYTFEGWVTEGVTDTTDKPTFFNGSYEPAGNVNFYALYSRTESSGGAKTYEMVEDTPADWTGNYVITYGTSLSSRYALKGLSGNTDYESTRAGGSVLYSDTGMTYDSTANAMSGVDDAYIWTVAQVGDYYTLQNVSTGTYLGVYNSALYSRSSYSNSYCRWTFSVSSGDVTASNPANSSYPYLSFHSNGYFMINSSAKSSIYFWKEKAAGTTTYTTLGTGGNAATEPVEVQEITEPVAEPNAVTNPDPVTATKTVWAPTTEINTTDEYLIGIKNGDTVYLLANYNGEYYYYTTSSSNKYMYLSVATIEDGYVTAATGAQSNLEYCKWKFGTARTGGVITNQYNTDYKLCYETSNLFQYSYEDSWTYSATSGTLKSGSYYVYQITISGSPYAGVTSTQQSNNIVLYRKTTINTGYTVTAAVNNSSNGSVSPASATVEENQSTNFTVTPNTGYAIGSVSVNPSTAATASFSGNTVTVSGVTADCTVTVNLVRTYTVTFKDWDGTVLKTETVNHGAAATAPIAPTRTGFRFTGWAPSDFSNVTGDMTVTAQYEAKADYKVKFLMPDGSLAPDTAEVPVPTTGVQLVAPPTTNPHMDGYTFVGWAVNGEVVDVYDYPITDDTVFTAIFSLDADNAKTYTFYLRAVYEDKVDPKTTHINWYADNGTYEFDKSEDVVINTEIAIEAPTKFSYPGHTFIGWARMPETVAGAEAAGIPDTAYHVNENDNTKIDEYYGLDSDDLWLVWNPTKDATGGYYTVRENGTLLNGGAAFEYVSANERVPYHGLYAVWKTDVFYVVHSSTGVMEAYAMPFNKTTTVDGKTTYEATTFNLYQHVSGGKLYGGYYSAYGGVNEAAVDAIKDGYTYQSVSYNATVSGNTQSISWAEADATTGDVVKAEAKIDLDAGTMASFTNFVPYTGASDKVNTTDNTRFWVKGKAAGRGLSGDALIGINGTAMTPVAGTVYYLKEVPVAYLPNRALSINDKMKTEGNEITDIYMLSATDDLNYAAAGFNMGTEKTSLTANTNAVFSRSFIVIYKGPEGTDVPKTITPKTLNSSITNGWVMSFKLGSSDIDNLKSGCVYVEPTWTTFDGVEVEQNLYKYNITNGTTLAQTNP